jgi:hypothetical protein
MSISRRQFFRGFVGHSEDRQREQEKRKFAVESYVRTNLLPYDFSLTPEQTVEALAAALGGVNIEGEDEPLTYDRRARLREIVESMVDGWRQEHLQAEDKRRDAAGLVEEFLSFEANPEELMKLAERFHPAGTTSLKEEVERQLRVYLSDLPNARLANCSATELRDLVFSEIRSWC